MSLHKDEDAYLLGDEEVGSEDDKLAGDVTDAGVELYLWVGEVDLARDCEEYECETYRLVSWELTLHGNKGDDEVLHLGRHLGPE